MAGSTPFLQRTGLGHSMQGVTLILVNGTGHQHIHFTAAQSAEQSG